MLTFSGFWWEEGGAEVVVVSQRVIDNKDRFERPFPIKIRVVSGFFGWKGMELRLVLAALAMLSMTTIFLSVVSVSLW